MMRFALFVFVLAFGNAQAQSAYESALAAHQAGNLAKAEQFYREALRDTPKSFAVNYNFGLLLLQTRRPALALERFNIAAIADPKRFEPTLARANAHLDLGKPELALQALTKGEAACGSVPQYWLLRGEVELRLQKKESALSSAERAEKLSKSDYKLLYQCAGLFARLNKRLEAARALRGALALHPNDPNLLGPLANLLIESRLFDEALSVSREFIKAQPKNSAGAVLESYALEGLGRKSELIPSLDSAVERGCPVAPVRTRQAEIMLNEQRGPEAKTYLDDALRAEPKFVPALLLRSQFQLRSGSALDAAIDASTAVQVEPLNSGCYRAAYAAFKALKFDNRALACLRSWARNIPSDAEPLRILGPLLESKNENDEAVGVYERLHRLRPDDAVTVASLASVYLATAKVNEAISLVTEAISQGVDNPDSTISLALAYRMNGENAKAIGVLKGMQKRYPKDLRGWLLLANTHERMSALGAAYEVYDEAKRLFPNDPAGYEGMASVLSKQKKYAEAAAAWLEVLNKFPSMISALPLAAEAYERAGKSSESEEVWKHALETNTKPIEVRLLRASYLISKKRYAAAVEDYKRVLATDPTRTEVYSKIGETLNTAGEPGACFDFLRESLPKIVDDERAVRIWGEAAVTAKRLDDYDSALDACIQSGALGRPICLAFVNSMARRSKIGECISALSELSVKTPQNGGVWLALSRAHALHNDAKSALEALEKAARLLPQDQQLLKTFASAAETANDAKMAAVAFGLLYALLPDDVGVCLKYAAYLIESDQKSKAKQMLSEAVQRFPDEAQLKKLLNSIS